MPLTCAQIVTLSCQIAKCPGYTAQAGQMLNAILRELAEDYDFDIMKVTNFTVVTGTTLVNNGAGPYNLPENYLRASPEEVNYIFNGEPYVLVQFDMPRWRALFQGPGIQDLPRQFATDFSTVQTLGNPQAYLWPPPNGAYNILWPYFMQHADIATPETSVTVPWMPSTTYLYTRLAGELMKITDDDRTEQYLGDGTDKKRGLAADILEKYLISKDDKEGYAQQVKLDRNAFKNPNWNSLQNTKQIGW